KHLAQHCRLEYPSGLNVVLWVIAEINVIASDIPQVVGTAIALNLLFRIPLWAGVLITGCSALLLLALERFGHPAAPCSREIRGECSAPSPPEPALDIRLNCSDSVTAQD
ncbi:unnamed protein product, partial [Closterium sp. NIES-54]